MAEALLTGELGSDRMVRDMEWRIQARAERYTELVHTRPMLSIISGNSEHQPSATYMALKRKVGEGLGIAVHPYLLDSAEAIQEQIERDNDHRRVNGIIVQLPLREGERHLTDELLALVAPEKDIDGLAPNSPYVSPTVTAVEIWLEGHGIDCSEEDMVLIGLGRLVNRPLLERLRQQGARSVQGFDKNSPQEDVLEAIHLAHIVISATGHPGLLTPEWFRPDTGHKVLVDVGTAEQNGAQQGDVSDELREYALAQGWALTPKVGGIGKITVRALLANLMDAAEMQAGIYEPLHLYRLRQSLEATSSLRRRDLFEVER